jgi:23S rRNA (uracil1939-C5)-methyltransferase
MSRRHRPKLPTAPVTATIESLAHDGRGVTRMEGKAVFVRGALAGEVVRFVYTHLGRSHDEGRVETVLEASPDRVAPRCPHFGLCGGCSLQHLAADRQILAKQDTLLANLRRLGGVEPEGILPPLTGPHWGYRHKARLGVRYVPKKGRVLVGFREASSSKVADLGRCEVLHPSVGERLADLAQLIAGLRARERIPQIEVAVGDEVSALVFRHLDPLDEADLTALRGFAAATGLHVYLQPGGPESVHLLWPEASELRYRLPAHGVDIRFLPTDFTQVNLALNRAMVDRALDLLDPRPGERVLDLFCGLGNFTLPIARRGAQVVGVEGEASLVARAQENARRNGIDNAEFIASDLAVEFDNAHWLEPGYAKVLLDPPRSGAWTMLPHIARAGARRVVYVSCHPGTLARDAGALVTTHGYRLVQVGVMDMFPHTAHVESIALFERG